MAKVEVRVGNSTVFLNFYVLDTDIPPLLGSVAMRKLRIVIDVEQETAYFRDIGELCQLLRNRHGHLFLDIENGGALNLDEVDNF